MAKATTGTLLQAGLGAVLITLLLLPFQGLTPYAPYTPLAILPVVLFFSLGLPLGGLVAMFLSFLAGAAWGGLFMLVAGALPDVPEPTLLGVGITLMIFLILAVHPLALAKTPFGIVPVVLLGFVEVLMVMLMMPLVTAGEPALDLLWTVIIFGYGCVMTAVMVAASERITRAVLGADWRGPGPSAPDEQPRTPERRNPHVDERCNS